MAGPEGGGTAGWAAAVALSAVVLFMPALSPLPLVALPGAVLLLALSPRPRFLAYAGLILAWLFVLFPPAGWVAWVARGWGLLLGGGFAAAILLRPRWSAFSRALAVLGAVLVGVVFWIAASGTWSQLDWLLAEHFRSAAQMAAGELVLQLPESPWAEQLGMAAQQAAEWQGRAFPALLGLQSLAALSLAWWIHGRLAGRTSRQVPQLRPLREFRFNDQLVWILILGLLLLLLPLGAAAARAGLNALLFMGGLYALRGIAIFVYLVGAAPSLFSMVLGVLAALLLYPMILMAALLVGLSDTWLDVRARVALASRA